MATFARRGHRYALQPRLSQLVGAQRSIGGAKTRAELGHHSPRDRELSIVN